MCTSSAEEIVNQALKQSKKQRAFIAETLINSLDTEIDDDVEIAWQIEIDKRLKDIDSGKVKCISWEEVRSRLHNSKPNA